MTLISERPTRELLENPRAVSPLSSEQAALAGGLLLGLVPELDNLISDLRMYQFNEHTPLNRRELVPHSKGLQFKALANTSMRSTIEWHRVPRQHVPDTHNDTMPKEGFPVTMREWHPTLLPPRTQLVIPNVSIDTLDEASAGMPYELTMANMMTTTPRRTSPALVLMAGPDTGASSDIVRPFAASDDATLEVRASQINKYMAALTQYVGDLVSIGTELNVASAEPLAERFLK